jgi:hypothetical protein
MVVYSLRQQHGALNMAIEARIRELDARHQSLERQIEEEMSHPSSDDLRVRELKRQKLRLKEELESLRTTAH